MAPHYVSHSFARLLRWHGKGRALFDPVESDQISLGSVGFFDDKGRWNSMNFDINHPPAGSPVKPFSSSDIDVVADKEHSCCNFASELHQQRMMHIGIGVDGTAFSIPLSVETEVSGSCDGRESAFLHCEQFISSRFTSDFIALRNWGTSNARNIFKTRLVTKKYGFFVVTAVHRCKELQLKYWSDTGTSIAPALGATVASLPIGGTIAAAIDADRHLSGWVIRPSKIDQSSKAERYFVVFVEGIHFMPWFLGTYLKITEERAFSRRGESKTANEDPEDSSGDSEGESGEDIADSIKIEVWGEIDSVKGSFPPSECSV